MLVDKFLSGYVGFCDIFDVVSALISQRTLYDRRLQNIKSIIDFDQECREVTLEHLSMNYE